MSELSITVGLGITPDEEPPTQGPALPRARGSKAREAYDQKRRPQAALMYRMLRERHEAGMSWRECWALGEGNDDWDVGPIIVWMRSRGVSVEARYDPVVGETRFYLVAGEGVGVSGGG
jgi:hypothetical protein